MDNARDFDGFNVTGGQVSLGGDMDDDMRLDSVISIIGLFAFKHFLKRFWGSTMYHANYFPLGFSVYLPLGSLLLS